MADLTQFDIRSARRIARVVQAVEQEPRRASPLTFDPVVEQRRDKPFRVCTFTGEWAKNSAKVVTLKNQTTTPNTVSASNLLFSIVGPATSGASTTKVCIVGKEGTAWYFVNTEKESCEGRLKAKELDSQFASDLSDATDISDGEGAQVLVNDAGCVRWVSLKKMTVIMNFSPTEPLTLTSDGLEYAFKEVFVIDHLSDGQGHTIPVTSCATTTGA